MPRHCPAELRGRPPQAARRRIKELEAELALVTAATALLDEGGASPKGSSDCRRERAARR